MTITLAPDVTVNGKALDAKWLERLVGMRVDRQLGLVGRATLRFNDFGAALAGASIFGLGTKVVLGQVDGPEIFSGTVVGIALDQGEERLPELVVTADDAAHKLGLGTTTTAYLNSSYGGIVSTIASNHGLSSSSKVAESATLAYLLQSGSDLDFLNEICARTGRVWWLEGATTLRFEKAGTSDSTVQLKFGTDLDSFAVRANGLRPDKVQVVGWDPAQQAEIVGNSPGAAADPESELVSGYPGRTSGSTTLVVRDASPLTADEATTMATSIFAAASSEAVVARGAGDFAAAIAPSVTVNVSDAGPASGSYLVTGVEHVYDRGGFITRFTAGPHRPSHLVDVLGAPAPENGFALPGVLTGVVTNVADPDNQGKVKVKYATQGTTVESPWARIVTIGAGQGRGFEFQPEVNDEVLVAFEQGDTRRPLVLGGLYSAKNTLPTSAAPGNVDGSKIAYRRITSRLGHVIEFADGSSDETKHVLIKLAGGAHKIRLGADRIDVEVANKPLSITNGPAKIEFSDSGDITIQGKSITLKSDAAIDIQAGAKATVKGQGGVDIQGPQVQVKADTMASVEGTAQLALKGGMVMIN